MFVCTPLHSFDEVFVARTVSADTFFTKGSRFELSSELTALCLKVSVLFLHYRKGSLIKGQSNDLLIKLTLNI